MWWLETKHARAFSRHQESRFKGARVEMGRPAQCMGLIMIDGRPGLNKFSVPGGNPSRAISTSPPKSLRPLTHDQTSESPRRRTSREKSAYTNRWNSFPTPSCRCWPPESYGRLQIEKKALNLSASPVRKHCLKNGRENAELLQPQPFHVGYRRQLADLHVGVVEGRD